MDEAIIIEAFKASLQLDNEPNQNVQALISSIQTSIEGLIPKLMSIFLSDNPIEIRQLAATYIKNLSKIWEDSKREFPLPQADKTFLRTNVIKCLKFSIPNQIRSQFKEIAYQIIRVDFPWEGIFQQIDEALESDVDQVYAGLTLIHQVAKVYQYQTRESRKCFEALIDRTLGKLDKFLEAFLNDSNADAYWYILLILKIYWTSFKIEYPLSFSIVQQLDLWLGKLKNILESSLGSLETQAENEEDAKSRDLHPNWVCKKKIAQLLSRFFARYFMADKGISKSAGNHFESHWANPLLSAVLALLYKKPACYIPEKVTTYLLECVIRALKLKNAENIIKMPPTPNGKLAVPALISDVIISVLYRTRSDELAWQENPAEFLRKEKNFANSICYIKNSAISLLEIICEKGNLQLFLDYTSVELQSNPQIFHKEAILYALGSISRILKEKKDLSESIKNLLIIYVLPEFSSRIGFLRAIACWVFAQFSSFLTADLETQLLGFEKISQMMLDPDLPVRFEAALAFPRTLDWRIPNEKLSGYSRNIIEVYLKLMSQVDNEELIDALGVIVEKFQAEVTDYAAELIKYLLQFFLKITKNIDSINEDEGFLMGASILKIIDKLVSYLENKPQELLAASHLLVPVFNYCFNEYLEDFIHEAAILLARLLYSSPNNFLPHLFPFARCIRTYLLGEGNIQPCGLYNSVEFFSPIANFISKYPLLTATNLDIFLSIGLGLSKNKNEESNILLTGCKVLIVLLENLKGSLDQHIPTIINQVSNLYGFSVNKIIKAKASEVICISLWNNPIVTIQTLQNTNILKNIWKFCFGDLKQYQESLAKRYAILGLSSIIVTFKELPSFFSEKMPELLKKILELWKNIDEDVVMDERPEEEEEEEDTKMDEESDDWEDEDIVFSDLYDSPIESLELREHLKNTFLNVSISYPDIHSQACEILTEEEMLVLNQILN
ncbi:unnamed protein product [Blepharisma stoltei]|uniref:Importin N-terminal domain-containing protein n=1 Tax=Blepharisma stoltei TaxID=1481888 RepID=A0AAU9JEL5_9CILI|nr:unnamed protein product [Blepharisma stoltei]